MIESPSETASGNRLLAMLPRATMQRILPSMVRVGLPLQTRLLASGLAYDAIYFPLDALVVLTHTDEHARTAGIARRRCVAGTPFVVHFNNGSTSMLGPDERRRDHAGRVTRWRRFLHRDPPQRARMRRIDERRRVQQRRVVPDHDVADAVGEARAGISAALHARRARRAARALRRPACRRCRTSCPTPRRAPCVRSPDARARADA